MILYGENEGKEQGIYKSNFEVMGIWTHQAESTSQTAS